ncbi:hypothetical protein DNTS_033412 [Danionella cerebrum]|uniref:fructose-2,6-bisphosphate 2-phosphatase n=1 Tax=Danionella cerebrum TaxID=2873325 RepID=A0A553MMY1_9TELE|nr:hypothetical protein DNTS_033412 [Danionella translucida]
MLAFGLTIVRHGETQCNKDGLLQGQKIDSSLSDIGIRQAEAAGDYLRDVQFSNVFVSPMKRAKQTAEIIVRNNRKCPDLELIEDPSLIERCFGVAEGGRVIDMKNMAKVAGQSLPEFTPPQGESMEQVTVRIKEFLKTMFQRLVNTHQHYVHNAETNKTVGATLGRPDDGASNLPVHTLLVGHGAYMGIAMHYFFEELKCPLPRGLEPGQQFSLCPNTGMCRFIITLKCTNTDPVLSEIKCVFINRSEHMKPDWEKFVN